MTETFRIAGYTRISVDDEIDRDNVSIENQKAIIEDFVKTQFPGSSLTFSRTATAPATPLSNAKAIRRCAAA